MSKQKSMKKVIIAICIIIGLYVGYSLLPREFDNKDTLENIMEIQLPNYKVKKYISDSSIDIHGDYCDTICIEFDSLPSKAFIESVKRKVELDKNKEHKRWLKHDEHQYRFQASDGDGGNTPKCRQRKKDWFVSLDFSDNSRDAILVNGYY